MDVMLDELLILLGGKEVELAKLRMELGRAQARIKELESALSNPEGRGPVQSSRGEGYEADAKPAGPLVGGSLRSA
jgi:hypothetical protein